MFIWFSPGLRQPRGSKKKKKKKKNQRCTKTWNIPLESNSIRNVSSADPPSLSCVPHSPEDDPQTQPNWEKEQGVSM